MSAAAGRTVPQTLAELIAAAPQRPVEAVRVLAPEPALDARTPIEQAAGVVADRVPAQQGKLLTVAFADGRTATVTPEQILSAVLAGRHTFLRIDPLTGLFDHSGFLTEAGHLLSGDTSGAVMMIVNVDRFKDINVAYGHDAGDALLRLIADALRRLIAGRGITARLGRDEYALLVTDPTSWLTAAKSTDEILSILGGHIQQAIRGPFPGSGIPVEVEVSVGVAGPAGPTDTAVALLRRADSAMHKAKLNRIGVEVWTPQRETIQRDDLALLAELRRAIPGGQLLLHYQPLIDASTGRLHGVEALVRWLHPKRGMIPPAAFLPQAERSDVIFPLTDWVLEEALRQVARWIRVDVRLPVSVNVSAVCLAREALAGTVFRLLDAYQVPPDLLTIEVTESAVMTDVDRAAARLTVLRERGVRVSIDDFGTGHTSLLLLTQLPIDELKLDQAFVSRVNDSMSHRAVVRSVAGIAHGLGITAVGEGIEDESTAEALRAHGYTLLQGYHFGRPVPPEQIVALDRPQPVPVEIARVLAAASAPVESGPTSRAIARTRPPTPTMIVPSNPGERRQLDAIAAVSALICNASTGLLLLCGEVGYDLRGAATPRYLPPLDTGNSPLLNTACDEEWLEIMDASLDARFAGDPLTRDCGYRFFAAAPVRDPSGTPFGVLCALDEAPQRSKPMRRPALQSLADSCGALLTGTTASPDLRYILDGLQHRPVLAIYP